MVTIPRRRSRCTTHLVSLILSLILNFRLFLVRGQLSPSPPSYPTPRPPSPQPPSPYPPQPLPVPPPPFSPSPSSVPHPPPPSPFPQPPSPKPPSPTNPAPSYPTIYAPTRPPFPSLPPFGAAFVESTLIISGIPPNVLSTPANSLRFQKAIADVAYASPSVSDYLKVTIRDILGIALRRILQSKGAESSPTSYSYALASAASRSTSTLTRRRRHKVQPLVLQSDTLQPSSRMLISTTGSLVYYQIVNMTLIEAQLISKRIMDAGSNDCVGMLTSLIASGLPATGCKLLSVSPVSNLSPPPPSTPAAPPPASDGLSTANIIIISVVSVALALFATMVGVLIVILRRSEPVTPEPPIGKPWPEADPRIKMLPPSQHMPAAAQMMGGSLSAQDFANQNYNGNMGLMLPQTLAARAGMLPPLQSAMYSAYGSPGFSQQQLQMRQQPGGVIHN